LTAAVVAVVLPITLAEQQLLAVLAEAAEAVRVVKAQAAEAALVKTVLLVPQTVEVEAEVLVLGRKLLTIMVVLAVQEK
jgi:hypothetical protein